jgi:hypothetical protein
MDSNSHGEGRAMARPSSIAWKPVQVAGRTARHGLPGRGGVAMAEWFLIVVFALYVLVRIVVNLYDHPTEPPGE